MRRRRVSKYSSNGRQYPQIRLCGTWLEEHGYFPGTEFDVSTEDGVLLIHRRSDSPSRPIYCAEQEEALLSSQFDISQHRVELSLSRPQATDRPTIRGPADVAQLLTPLQTYDREAFYAIHMDTRNGLCGLEQISLGTVNATGHSPASFIQPA